MSHPTSSDDPGIERRTPWFSSIALVALVICCPILCQMSGCGEAGSIDERYVSYNLLVPASGNADATTARERLIEDIDEADESVRVAVSFFDDEAVADALIRARDRGVKVRVVSDADFQDTEAMDRLEQARITPSYGDGELVYLPDFFIAQVLQACQFDDAEQVLVCSSSESDVQGSIRRPGSFNRMTDNLFVIDEQITWNFTLPLDGRREVHPIAWRSTGSEFSRAHSREIDQMFGGVFATTLDTYSGPLKSINDMHTEYHTSTGPIEVRFNPQERLTKEIIDEVYRAKSSVYVMSNNIMSPFLLDALEYKANNGFDVQIVVNGAAQANGSPSDRLDALGATELSMVGETLPTIIILDSDDEDHPRVAMVLSHELVRGAPYEVERREPDDFVYIYPSDTFFDGNMWVIEEYGDQNGARPEIDRLLDYWQQVKEQ